MDEQTETMQAAPVADFPNEGEFTTAQLQTDYGIPPRLANRWGPRLSADGLARKILLGGNGYWLYQAGAIEILLGRVGKAGRPHRVFTDEQVARVREMLAAGRTVKDVAVYIDADWMTAFRLTNRIKA